ncbi:haloacid dehalogenase [Alphaproteobacteria bacterium]|nr:haloacid dehalogenase [Alphaproteobacteria bacterium]
MKFINGISEVIEKYDFFILDIWGVIHDGRETYPNVNKALQYLKKNNKIICLLSNAPRRVDKVIEILEKMSISDDLYDFIITSGETVYNFLKNNALNNYSQFGKKYFYIGPKKDVDLIKDLDYYQVSCASEASFIITTGFDNDNSIITEKLDQIIEAKKFNLPMICANPDLVVIRRDGSEMPCAGVIAQQYEDIGGEVIYFGKPYVQVYEYASESYQRLYNKKITLSKIIAIGDGLETDIKGANNYNIDNILITSGILSNKLEVKFGEKANYSALEKVCQHNQIFPKFVISNLKI